MLFVRRRIGVFDTSRLLFRVWPTDCDLNLHMNNGRYLTFMDLGRIRAMAEIGLLRLVMRNRWQPVLAAAEITFIRGLAPFQRFALVTRLLTWDEKYFYLEQRFEHGDSLYAVAMVKGLFVKQGKRVPSSEMLAALGVHQPAPEMPELVRHWNELNVLKKAHTDKA